MDDIVKRVTNLSPTKRTLLEVRLRKKASPKSAEGASVKNDMVERIASLSRTKRTLLELKLRKKIAAKSLEDKVTPDDIVRRIAQLPPAKRALLELKLKKMAATTISSETELATDDILRQIAQLSPAKRALLEFRLTKKKDGLSSPTVSTSPIITPEIETPEELITTDSIDIPISTPSESQEAVTTEPPDVPISMPSEPEEVVTAEPIDTPISAPPEIEEAGAADKVSDWLSDILPEEPETPAWLLDDISDEEEVALQPPSEEAEFSEVDQEPPTPDWLTGLREGTEDEEAVSPSDSDTLNFDEEPELPDWLSDVGDTAALFEATQIDEPVDPTPEVAASPPPAEAGKSSWVEALKPTIEEAVTDEVESKIAEDTGMLSGIPRLLPAEKIAVPTRETDSLHEAAQEFLKIATEAPQPATLPTPLTRRGRVVGGAVRSVLYLFFLAVIALPLLLDTQAPWSEPSGEGGEVLDSQRRQLISEQLGIIDLQQPGSVALVSFDYSTATQGEMKPLAEAIIGRLKGQGMRIVAVSLEPEGATIAQHTLEDILTERDQADQYGVEMINLGYLPGQVAAIRALVMGQRSLSTIPDYEENVALSARSEWAGIQNLDQVDIVVTFADNPTTARWWIEQLEAAPQLVDNERLLLAATSASAEPFLRPYRESEQLDGLISGINGAAAIEAGRNIFDSGSARRMLDSVGIATIVIIFFIVAGIIFGWMPSHLPDSSAPETANAAGESVTNSQN